MKNFYKVGFDALIEVKANEDSLKIRDNGVVQAGDELIDAEQGNPSIVPASVFSENKGRASGFIEKKTWVSEADRYDALPASSV